VDPSYVARAPCKTRQKLVRRAFARIHAPYVLGPGQLRLIGHDTMAT
jgi:hypothetical protein